MLLAPTPLLRYNMNLVPFFGELGLLVQATRILQVQRCKEIRRRMLEPQLVKPRGKPDQGELTLRLKST